MKRIVSLVLVLVVCMSLCACATKSGQENKLEGYYHNPLNGARFCFEITEYGSGEYGGILTDLTDTTNVSVWSIEGTTVYVNGNAHYTYSDGLLLGSVVEEIVVGENNSLTGTTEKYCLGNSSNDTVIFNADGTVTHYRMSYAGKKPQTVEATGHYVVEGNVVEVYEEDNKPEYNSPDISFYIVNQKLYNYVLCPI